MQEGNNISQGKYATILREMIMGFRTTQLIYVAAKLNIADHLRQGPQQVDVLAKVTGAHPSSLYRLLRALASIGIFEETDDGCFQLTPLAGPLQTDVSASLHAVAMLYGENWCWQVYGNILHSVITGQPAFPHVHGQIYFEYLNNHHDAAETFNKAMTAFSEQEINAVLSAYDFSAALKVVDVGGGHGRLITAILNNNKQAHGILFDQISVLADAKNFITNAALKTRCELIAGDFFHSAPPGGDLYILKSIIHDWDDEMAIRILKNCRRVMMSDARVVLAERVVPQGNEPSEAKLFDINMLTVLGGRERTVTEYKNLLRAADLQIINVIPTSCHLSLIEAVPVRNT